MPKKDRYYNTYSTYPIRSSRTSSRYGTTSPSLGDAQNIVLTPYPRTPATISGSRVRQTSRTDYFLDRTVSRSQTVKIPSAPEVQFLDADIDPPIIQFKLVFEDIGGHEILNVSRHDLINGQNISYQPIRNASLIATQFSSQNLIELGQTSNEIFSGFKIQLEDYLPNVGNGQNGEYVYLDDDGNVIIEVVNILDEEVEIQLVSNINNYEETNYADGAMS